MGATLANFHVYNVHAESIKPLVNNDYSVLEISAGWTSILGIEIGEADRVAGKLSKQINEAVFSFMYFDDDLMSLKLFKDGKRIAHYETYYESEPYFKNCGEYLRAAGLDAAMERRLRKVFKCEDLKRKLEMLEEFFGVAFYIDASFIKEGTEKYIRFRGDEIYRTYDEERKRLNSIKNRTKAVLTQEMDAKLSPGFTNSNRMENLNYFILSYPNADGNYTGEWRLFEFTGDHFKPMLEGINLPMTPELFYGKNEISFRNGYFGNANKCVRVTIEGKIIAEAKLPLHVFIGDVSEEGDIICFTGIEPKNMDKPLSIIKLDKTGVVKWNYVAGGYSDIRHIVTYNSCTYAFVGHYGDKKYNEIIKLSPEGKLLSCTETLSFVEELFFAGGFLYYIESRYIQGKEQIITKATESLERVSSILLTKGVSILGSGVFDNDGKVYYDAFDDRLNQIVCIDLVTLEYKIVEHEPNLYINFSCDGMLYCISGNSTLCILNNEHNIISRHRLKGNIARICITEMGIHVVTYTEGRSSTVRVYRICPF